MHVHKDRPACYLANVHPANLPLRAPQFRDGGKWCYQSIEWARNMTPGCFGCSRFQEEIMQRSNETQG